MGSWLKIDDKKLRDENGKKYEWMMNRDSEVCDNDDDGDYGQQFFTKEQTHWF